MSRPLTAAKYIDATFDLESLSSIPLNGKIALVTGVTGQDGSYLAELLLSKGYIFWATLMRKGIDFSLV